MTGSWRVVMPLDFFAEECSLDVFAVVAHDSMQFFLCSNDVSAVVAEDASHLSSASNKSSQGVDEGVGFQGKCYLHMNSSALHTCKNHAITFAFLSCVLDDEGSKEICSSVGEWGVGGQPFLGQVSHQLILWWTLPLSAVNTIPDDLPDLRIGVDDPIFLSELRQYTIPSSMAQRNMTMPNNQSRDMIVLWKNDWMLDVLALFTLV